MLRKLNEYFVPRKKLTLIVMWVLFGIAITTAMVMNVFWPAMPLAKYYGIVIIPSIPMIYFRVLYGRARDYAEKQAEENAPWQPPVQKKKKKKR